MEKLLEGFRKFRSTYYRAHRHTYRTLAQQGQTPRAMVIACVDSRIDPQMMLDAELGEIIVVRNVANLVPPFTPDGGFHGTSAALEFAVRRLNVAHVIVLGHAGCGGIAALLADPREADDDFISQWMATIRAARTRALALVEAGRGSLQRLSELEGIRSSLTNLSSFPWVRDRVAAGALTLHGWYFEIETGDLYSIGPDGEFHPV
jgi:carbonic anhydrase